jgi:hypothetical protein
MEPVNEALRKFESIVPFGDEAFMVLKAHLLAERHLCAYIESRLSNPAFMKEVESPYCPVSSGLGLILLAQALSLRDEVPPTCSDILWPALKELNELRNRLAHELDPDQHKVQKKMRQFVKLATGAPCTEGENLNRLFYSAAQRIVAYLTLDREPLTMEDTLSDPR